MASFFSTALRLSSLIWVGSDTMLFKMFEAMPALASLDLPAKGGRRSKQEAHGRERQ
jgi:hypothetical protein